MQRIFTLEGNNYSNQTEFEVLLKEVQEGLSKNQNILKQYEVTKKEEDIQLKELDLIFAKLNQETTKIIQFFDKDLSSQVNQKLSDFIQQTSKQAQSEKQATENQKQGNNNKTLDLNAFDQISKLFSSGAKASKNLQESDNEQENTTQQQNLTKQRLVEIQNLNPAINNNSTPIASKPSFTQNGSAGFSNLKFGNYSTAQTSSYAYSDQKVKSDNLNSKSAANSAIKGYSILSAAKCQIPQSMVANENDSAQINSHKKKETPAAFSSVFPQSVSSKKLSPTEKRIFTSTINQPSNIVFVTNTNNAAMAKNDCLENLKSKIQILTNNLTFENFTQKSSENNCKIKNIGGNLSPISKPQNIEDELHQTAKEIIQENNIEWLDNDEYDLIDRGQYLQKERKQAEIEDFNSLKQPLSNQEEEDEDDALTQYDNDDDDSNDLFDKDDDLLQLGDEIYEQDKENNNQQSFYRQSYIKNGQIQNINGYQSSSYKGSSATQNGAYSQIQQNQGQEVDKKKEKRLRKRLSKKLKKLRQQHDLIEQEQMQLKLKQVEEEKKQSLIKLNETSNELSSSKQFQYSSCNPANKRNTAFKGAANTNTLIQNSAEKSKQLLLSDSKVNKESNFQNLLSQMKNNQQQNQNLLNSLNQQNLLKDQQQSFNQKTTAYQSKIYNQIVSPNKQEAVHKLERDQSPDLQHFSNVITNNQIKKKIKTNPDQFYEGGYKNLEQSQIRPQQHNFGQSQIIKNNNNNTLRNNLHNQFEYDQKSQNINKLECSLESYSSFQQSMSAFQSQNSTYSNKKDLGIANSQIKTNFNNKQQQSQIYSNNNTQKSFINNQYQPNQYQNNIHNNILNDGNIMINQQRYPRYAERFQEFSQSQLKMQNNFQSSQESFQVPQKPNQQPVIARHNSLIRPYSQNYQQQYAQKQNSLDTSTPFEEQINSNNSKLAFNYRSNNNYQKNFNYSNPYTFVENNDERVLNKNQTQQQQLDNVGNLKLQSEISQGLEQIQQQIEFSNSLREQLERKIKEEQQSSDKYQQHSSTQRLKFQIMDNEFQNNRNSNNLKPLENQIYNPIERSYQAENISSLDEQNQSQYDDQSPLYSPLVQFSPMESDEIA